MKAPVVRVVEQRLKAGEAVDADRGRADNEALGVDADRDEVVALVAEES